MKRHRETVELPGARIEVERMGSGPPLVLLQSAEAYESGLDIVDRLAGSREVFLPWAPGYGGSPLPDDVCGRSTMSPMSILDLIERYDLRDIVLVGCSLGGWIAAEMATKTCEAPVEARPRRSRRREIRRDLRPRHRGHLFSCRSTR